MYGRAGFLVFAILVGCGGGALKSDPNGGPGTGGAGGGQGGCANLACLQQVNDLLVECAPGGSCVSQPDSASVPMTNTSCYDNGVKIRYSQMSGSPGSTQTETFEVKKGDMLCYTRTFLTTSNGTSYSMNSAVTDAAGTLLVTTQKNANDVFTVTCPGSPPTIFDASCGVPDTVLTNESLVPATAPACPHGSCTF